MQHTERTESTNDDARRCTTTISIARWTRAGHRAEGVGSRGRHWGRARAESRSGDDGVTENKFALFISIIIIIVVVVTMTAAVVTAEHAP
jgi:hypothetical protein